MSSTTDASMASLAAVYQQQADTISDALRDTAQAATVRAEAREAQVDRWRWQQKQRARRSARALAQLRLGERMRTAGVQFTPELEQLDVVVDDGTRPEHYAFQLHGLMFGLGSYDALCVWLPGEATPVYDCYCILDLGHAVKALGRRDAD